MKRQLIVALALFSAGAASGWQVQDWRLGERLAERDRLHGHTLAEIQRAAAGQAQREHQRRVGLEQQLMAESRNQYRKRTDAEHTSARLRDRLATADLRLSVLLAADPANPSGGSALPGATATGRLVDGAPRAELDPATAQRVLAIAEQGDRAVIALNACQAYVQALTLEPD